MFEISDIMLFCFEKSVTKIRLMSKIEATFSTFTPSPGKKIRIGMDMAKFLTQFFMPELGQNH